MKRIKMISLFLLASFLATALLPSGKVLANESIVKGAVPTAVSPSGLILDLTPTFTWNIVSGATQYRYQVVQFSTVIDQTFDSRYVCSSTICSMTSKPLGYFPYKWRVRAFVGGVWGNWSTYMGFTISSPSFASLFNGNMDGWDEMNEDGGSWYPSSFYMYTPGKPAFWSPLYRYANGGKYNDLDFTARIKRVGGNVGSSFPASCMMVRMGAFTTQGEYIWYPGYRFCINNTGKYEIWYMDQNNGTYAIQKWVYSPSLNVGNNWNKLRVIAKGSDFKFYINNTLIKSFTDSSKDRGFIGFTMYKYPSTNTQMQVDNATVYVETSTDSLTGDSKGQVELIPVSESSVTGGE